MAPVPKPMMPGSTAAWAGAASAITNPMNHANHMDSMREADLGLGVWLVGMAGNGWRWKNVRA